MSAADTAAALEKILRVKLPESLKSDALKLIVAQKLSPLKKPKRGRKSERSHIATFEILTLSTAIKKIIAGARNKNLTDAKFREKLLIQAKAEGFQSLDDNHKKKAKTGII
jgi:Tfp pilus assembly pilus retraction ATPase PilT